MHITQRGVDRCPTFLDDRDFATYLLMLRAATERSRCAIHAYVLMTNHVHLLLTPPDARGPAILMQLTGAWYVRYFNDRYQRTGSLWEGRYQSRLVTNGRYFFVCSRYIEQNPLRAGLVNECAEYHWSSFRHNACGAADQVLTPHALYAALSADLSSRCRIYRELCREDVSPEAETEIRTAPLKRRFPQTTYQRAVAARFGTGNGANSAFVSPTSSQSICSDPPLTPL
jgi:putative transposase